LKEKSIAGMSPLEPEAQSEGEPATRTFLMPPSSCDAALAANWPRNLNLFLPAADFLHKK
jgi:hypothetical protein